MNQCPHHAAKLRPELPPLPARMQKLPIDPRGYVVPFFVQKMPNGEWDFRVADSRKLQACIKLGLCWVCGQSMGSFKTFTIGPMCAINRTTAEPPEHQECALWSVKGCPFMSRPKMVRREDDLSEQCAKNVPGEMIMRNPGVMCVWTTKTYKLFSDGLGGRLINIGEPENISWWREGRPATRAEIMESIDSGLPLLREQCEREEPHRKEAAYKDLEAKTRIMLKLLPT